MTLLSFVHDTRTLGIRQKYSLPLQKDFSDTIIDILDIQIEQNVFDVVLNISPPKQFMFL